MIEKIIELIKNNSIETYSIIETDKEKAEVYFIKDKLSTNRIVNEKKYIVNIFRDFIEDEKKMRGNSSFFVYDGMGDEEINTKIIFAYESAINVRNLYYPLPKDNNKSINKLNNINLNEVIKNIADRIYKEDNVNDAFINSTEIFVTKNNVRIINSENIDVSYSNIFINGEFVTQKNEPENVELYNMFSFDNENCNGLEKIVKEALENTNYRANATKEIKSGNMDVVISGENVAELFDFYLTRANASSIYTRYSDWSIENDIQNNAIGDKLNIDLIATTPFSPEGIEMIDRKFIENGVLKSVIGNSRFSYYVGKEPTGIYEKIKVECGKNSNIKNDNYLEALVFSAFQIDPLSGYFGGEIRLGLLHENGNVRPVTGCSISGNIIESQKEMYLSNDKYENNHYIGPKTILFKNLSISGN